MKKFSSTLCAVLALSFTAATAVPASAAPVFVPKAEIQTSNVIDVQYRQQRREDRFEQRQDRRERKFENRQNRREARFERRNGVAYYNGQRGYSQRRAGYRQHNGFWFPAGAFIAGAIIGGAINNAQPQRVGSRHVEWCQDRFRSYRASDNTYNNGNGRVRCVSPYS